MTVPVWLGTLLHVCRARWRSRWLHGARLRRFQERRARRAVHAALRDAPFFRTHWAGHDLRRWDTLPTVDKQTMMHNFDDYTTRGVSYARAMEVALSAERSRDFRPVLDGLTVGLSSGTSGHRGLFVVSPAEQAAWAGTILARTLHRLAPRRLRVAFFLRSNSNLYQSTNGVLVQFQYVDLMTPIPVATELLNHLQPHIVVGPPSLLGMLAQEQTGGSLRIQPERLISVAEVLEAHDAGWIGQAFGAPVHQIYQCTEGLLAVSCERGSLHVQEDIVRIQWEPLGDGEAEGQRWTPIVTDLWRRAQPIIRYRLNDVVRLGTQPCACGSDWQVIAAVEGRRDDVCSFERVAGGQRPFFPDTLRRMVLLASPAITDYECVQEPDGSLCVQLEVSPDADSAAVVAAVRQSIGATIEDYGCVVPSLRVDTALVPPPPGAKRRRVRRRPANP